jgi:hypothetical protein
LPEPWEYRKAVDFWGTKWSDEISGEAGFYAWNDTGLYWGDVSLSTAWSPPIGGMIKASAKFPLVTFGITYMESGNAFAGYAIFSQNKCVEHCQEDMPDLPYDEENPDLYHDAEQEYWDSLELKMQSLMRKNPAVKIARTIL